MGKTDSPCLWCGELGDHKHYAVVVRENGKLLGRLCPDGSTTNRNVYAAVMSKARADRVASEINAGRNVSVSGLTAKVIPF